MSDIQSLADLRPGDIMFGPIGGAVGLGVGLGQVLLGEGFRVGTLSVRHVGIVTQAAREVPPFELPQVKPMGWVDGHRFEPPRMVQAMPSGAEEVDLTAERWTPRHAYVRLPEGYTGQAEDAAWMAREMVAWGVSYSFASYAALAAWHWGYQTPRLERWIDRRRLAGSYFMPSGKVVNLKLPAEAICSVLVDQAWSLTGYRVMEGVARQAVTPGAMADQLMSREGATWCRPMGSGRLARCWTV